MGAPASKSTQLVIGWLFVIQFKVHKHRLVLRAALQHRSQLPAEGQSERASNTAETGKSICAVMCALHWGLNVKQWAFMSFLVAPYHCSDLVDIWEKKL